MDLLSGILRKSKPIQVLMSEDKEDDIRFVQSSGKDKVSVSPSEEDEESSDS